jgi:hypothetical protein
MIASQFLRVTGTGTANLLTKGIDYHIVATILKAAPSSRISSTRLVAEKIEHGRMRRL